MSGPRAAAERSRKAREPEPGGGALRDTGNTLGWGRQQAVAASNGRAGRRAERVAGGRGEARAQRAYRRHGVRRKDERRECR